MHLAAGLPRSHSVGDGGGPFCPGGPSTPSTPSTPSRGHGSWPHCTPRCCSGRPLRSGHPDSQRPSACSEGGVFGARYPRRTRHLRGARSSWPAARMRCVCRRLSRGFPQGLALGQAHAQKAGSGRLARALARLPFEPADVAELEAAPSPPTAPPRQHHRPGPADLALGVYLVPARHVIAPPEQFNTPPTPPTAHPPLHLHQRLHCLVRLDFTHARMHLFFAFPASPAPALPTAHLNRSPVRQKTPAARQRAVNPFSRRRGKLPSRLQKRGLLLPCQVARQEHWDLPEWLAATGGREETFVLSSGDKQVPQTIGAVPMVFARGEDCGSGLVDVQTNVACYAMLAYWTRGGEGLGSGSEGWSARWWFGQ